MRWPRSSPSCAEPSLGLDVRKESIAAGILRPGRVEPDLRTLASTPEALRKLVSPMDRASLIACYEAGPTGYDTYRVLERLGSAARSSLRR